MAICLDYEEINLHKNIAGTGNLDWHDLWDFSANIDSFVDEVIYIFSFLYLK